jgi:hypothetical protein
MTADNKPHSPSRGFWIGLLVGVLAVAAWWWFLPCNAYKQAANMRLAAAHAEKIAPILQADPRFAAVSVHEYTGGRCGALWVIGSVQTESDLVALKDAVASTQPPTEVVYNISVLEAPPSSPG